MNDHRLYVVLLGFFVWIIGVWLVVRKIDIKIEETPQGDKDDDTVLCACAECIGRRAEAEEDELFGWPDEPPLLAAPDWWIKFKNGFVASFTDANARLAEKERKAFWGMQFTFYEGTKMRAPYELAKEIEGINNWRGDMEFIINAQCESYGERTGVAELIWPEIRNGAWQRELLEEMKKGQLGRKYGNKIRMANSTFESFLLVSISLSGEYKPVLQNDAGPWCCEKGQALQLPGCCPDCAELNDVLLHDDRTEKQKAEDSGL